MTVFINREHEVFFREKLAALPQDCYYAPLVYLVGLDAITRTHFGRIYRDGIAPECLTDGWQTSTTRRLLRLAFNLFNGCASDAYGAEINARQYAPENLFCCSYAPYFAEALRLRYPEYFRRGEDF